MAFAVARTRFANLMECLLFFCKVDGVVYVVAPCNPRHKVPGSYISGVPLDGFDPDMGNFRHLLSEMRGARGLDAPFKIAAAKVKCLASKKIKNTWRIKLQIHETKRNRVFKVESDKIPFMKDLNPESAFWDTVPSWDTFPEEERRELLTCAEKTRQVWNAEVESTRFYATAPARDAAYNEKKRQRMTEQ